MYTGIFPDSLKKHEFTCITYHYVKRLTFKNDFVHVVVLYWLCFFFLISEMHLNHNNLMKILNNLNVLVLNISMLNRIHFLKINV